MRFIRLLLWVATFLLAVTPAHAGPIAAAIAWLSTTLAQGGILAGLIKAALGIALQVGASLLQKAFAKKQPVPGIKATLEGGGDTPLSFIAGYYATAGHLNYVNTWGQNGKTPNAYLTMVIALSDIPVTGMRARLWVNGEPCTIEFDGTAVIQGYPVTEYRKASKDYMWVAFHDGTQTAADSFLTGKFSADVDRPFSSNMIGRGVAYAVVTMMLERELFSGIPAFVFEIDGVKLYDIRKDSTNGGSGTHRWNNQATWEASDNPVIIAYNIVRGVTYGSEWVFGGQNLAQNRLPASSWIAAANECDVAVSLAAGGTEKQYRAGVEIAVNNDPLSYVDELLKSCAGRMAEIGGIYKIRVGAPTAAVYSFTDEDVIITEGQSFEPFPGMEDTYNGAHATYLEPAEAWASKDAPPRYNATLEAEDDGRRLVADLAYAAVPYGTQVQRLMTSAVAEARRFRRHTITLPPDAWLLEPCDIVSWTSDRNGYVAKSFLIAAMDGSPAMNQAVSLIEVDPSDYDWNHLVDELPTSTGFLGPIVPPAQAMTGWQAEPWTLYDAAGSARRPTIRVGYDGDLDDVRAVQIQVRLAATQALALDGEAPYNEPALGAKYTVLNGTFIANTAYEIRGRYVPFSARGASWSDWVAVTTPDVQPTDVSVDLAALAADSYDVITQLRADLDRLQADIETLANATADATARNIVRHSATIATTRGQASAIQTLDAQVTTHGDEITAQAVALTTVSAKTDDGTAEGLMGWIAKVAPSGASARFAIQGRATSGNAFEQGGFYLDVLAGGGVRVTFDVDKFVVMNGSNPVAPFAIDAGVVKMQNVQIGSAVIADGAITSPRVGRLVASVLQ